jgi:23S rRNA (pseudouridine1915-N3)-methyltransferase
MAEHLIVTAKQAGFQPIGVEGEKQGDWVLVDLNDVVVHLMLPKRSRNADKQKLLNTEAAALSAALPDRCLRIAMDMGGRQWSTADLAGRLLDWQQDGRAVGIMIGGPDGLDQDLIASADLVWSLGPLTLPHPVVRLILAEQIYRAWTITTGHPYHRD